VQRYLVLALLIIAPPCFGDELTLASLNRAEALWRRHALSDYRFTLEQNRIAFAFPGEQTPVQVTVHNGRVTRCTFLAPVGKLPVGSLVASKDGRRELATTIPMLFTRMRSLLSEFTDERISFSAEFDAALGYPRSFSLVNASMTDVDYGFEVRDFEILQ
jgi:hypothetical protein